MGGRGCWGLKERGKKESINRLLHKPEPLVGGRVGVCASLGERERESYPETPRAICHIGMALELPGGPLIAGEFSGCGRGDEGWGPEQQREVRGHGPPELGRCVRLRGGGKGGRKRLKERKGQAVGE